MPPLFDLARRPLQPLIPQLDVKGWRTEDQQRHPLPPILGHIAQHPPNRIGVLEIMLGGYLSIETLPLGVLDEANGDYLQQQRCRRASIDQTIAKVNGHPPSSANPNQERQENLLTLATPNPYPTGCQPPWLLFSALFVFFFIYPLRGDKTCPDRDKLCPRESGFPQTAQTTPGGGS